MFGILLFSYTTLLYNRKCAREYERKMKVVEKIKQAWLASKLSREEKARAVVRNYVSGLRRRRLERIKRELEDLIDKEEAENKVD